MHRAVLNTQLLRLLRPPAHKDFLRKLQLLDLRVAQEVVFSQIFDDLVPERCKLLDSRPSFWLWACRLGNLQQITMRVLRKERKQLLQTPNIIRNAPRATVEEPNCGSNKGRDQGVPNLRVNKVDEDDRCPENCHRKSVVIREEFMPHKRFLAKSEQRSGGLNEGPDLQEVTEGEFEREDEEPEGGVNQVIRDVFTEATTKESIAEGPPGEQASETEVGSVDIVADSRDEEEQDGKEFREKISDKEGNEDAVRRQPMMQR